MNTLRPENVDHIAEIVASARADGKTIRIDGHGSRRAIGHDVAADLVLDMTALAGEILHEPDELVLTVSPGVSVRAVRDRLIAAGQDLMFDPADLGPLIGQPADRGTMGGLVATNLCGSRRLTEGGVRDVMLGISGVTGAGEIFKAGGRVMKNVTGFDLPRALTGSWGTLAIITGMTLKVLPRPEVERTVVVTGLTPAAAVAAMAAAMGSDVMPSAAAHVPEGLMLAQERAVRPLTLIGLHGTALSVKVRAERLVRQLADYGRPDITDDGWSRRSWTALRDMRPLWPDETGDAEVWRISVAPSRGHRVLESLTDIAPATRACLDWQGGLVWAAVPAGTSPEAVRDCVARQGGGHATLIRASAARRAAVDVFQPPEAGVALLSRRLKAAFDPDGVLEPGRLGRAI